MRRALLLLLLISQAHANQLTLEFAQEGDPTQQRALVVIHNTFESRIDMKTFFAAWAQNSWARDQYCSVYCYEYDGNGLGTLESSETLAADLYARITSNNSQTSGQPDDINPARRTQPTDHRQPPPDLGGSNLQLLLAGSGHGGLVARRVCTLANENGHPAHRVGYIGTPLDGLSTIDLVLGLTTERASLLSLENPLSEGQLETLAPAWWSLTDLFNPLGDWQKVFANAHNGATVVGAYGARGPEPHPTDNVLLARYRPAARDSTTWSDGWLPQAVAWGAQTGPLAWAKESQLENTRHADLTEQSTAFLLTEVVDRKVTFGFLARRQIIEEAIDAKTEDPPLYQYWDERDSDGMTPQWRDAYASRKELYEMMWGVAP